MSNKNDVVVCEFANCTQPLDTRWQPEQGMKLCQPHADEFALIAAEGDVAELMRFFVRAEGWGADQGKIN